MFISYKAVYHLLEDYFLRRSLNQLFSTKKDEQIFESSKVIAMALEDYSYLDIMVNKKDLLDQKYCLFIRENEKDNFPLILEKNKKINIVELAIISRKCPFIPEQKFYDIIESTSLNNHTSSKQTKEAFDSFEKIRRIPLR